MCSVLWICSASVTNCPDPPLEFKNPPGGDYSRKITRDDSARLDRVMPDKMRHAGENRLLLLPRPISARLRVRSYAAAPTIRAITASDAAMASPWLRSKASVHWR